MHSPLDTAITIKARQYIQQKSKKFVLQPKKSPIEFLIKKQEKQQMHLRNNFLFNVDTISQIPIQASQTKRMCTSQRTYRSKCVTGRPLNRTDTEMSNKVSYLETIIKDLNAWTQK